MPLRFFAPQLPLNSTIELPDEEGHHFARVLRGAVGDEIVLMDGRGREALARVISIRKSTVMVEVHLVQSIDREPERRLTLAVSLPKGDRQKWLVEKLTELGAYELLPLLAEHGVAQPTENALDRLRVQSLAACKQSGRTQILKIGNPISVDQLVQQTWPVRLFAHPETAPLASEWPATAQPAIVAIGPEGGFADSEVESLLANEWTQLYLGPRILRLETAAIAIAAKWLL